ncbi:MAG: TRAP transporter small permease, partial [Bradyrhizobium sp.]
MAMQLAEQSSASLLPATGLVSITRALERGLGAIVSAAAALLVVAEIGVLFAGVCTRYVFHRPLIWSDELAGILFLWLAMLDAAVAFQRGEHMRMTAAVGRLSKRMQSFLDVLAIAAPLAFLILVIDPAYEFAADEAIITTPALELSNLWRAAALPT